MTAAFESENPESRSGLTRRDFAKTLGSGALVASTSIGLRRASAACDETDRSRPSETAVARFHRSLGDAERKSICFPFDHPLRTQVSHNWAIVRPSIRDLTIEQRALCREIFQNLCGVESHDRFLRQMDEDYGGFDRYHVALFGEPGGAHPFEWVLTGRHNTLRADGNRESGAGFGGPIFYGHASPISGDAARNRNNVWWYQAELADKVFQSLDEQERARACVTRPARGKRREGEPLPEVGLDVGTLDDPRRALVRDLLKALLDPFRGFEVPQVRKRLRGEAATDTLRLMFFPDGDRGVNGLLNIWKLEGPGFAWYYHGSPHVHAWLNLSGSLHEA